MESNVPQIRNDLHRRQQSAINELLALQNLCMRIVDFMHVGSFIGNSGRIEYANGHVVVPWERLYD